MKRIILYVAVTLCIGVASLVLLPLLVSSEGIKERLNERFIELTGSPVSYRGRAELSLNPFLRVEVRDVSLSDEAQSNHNQELLHIEKLEFELKLLPLLFGKIRLSKFRLIRPKFILLTADDGTISWHGADRNATDENQQPSDIVIGQFEIVDGIVEAYLQDAPEPVRVSNLNAHVDWPNLHSRWEISGGGVWRGEAFNFYNVTKEPLALFMSGQSDLRFTLDSPVMEISFSGLANTVSGLQLQGNSKFYSPSLPRLVDLLWGDKNIKSPQLGSFTLDGAVSANAKEVRLEQASIKLDNNIAVGSLQFFQDQKKRPKITGTLAFSTLDIVPIIDSLSENQSKSLLGNAATAHSGIPDLDIRFSAQNYKFGGHSFGILAATAMTNGEEWLLEIGEADFFDGMLIASISSRLSEGQKTVEIKGAIKNAEMSEIARGFLGGEIIATGSSNIDFNLKVTDDRPLDNFRNYSGSVSAKLEKGNIEGLDLVKAIPALNENNGFVTIDDMRGTTAYDLLELDMLIFNGVGWITKGKAHSEKNEFRLSGKTDLTRGGLAIYADINEKSSTEAQNVRIFVGGTVTNPLVTHSPLPGNRPDERIENNG